MAEIHRTRSIAAPAQKIWDLLADFGALSSWADNADHSCILFRGAHGGPVGTARRVQIKREALVEQITEFDPPRALSYDIEGLPSCLRRVTNRWTLAAPTFDSSVVTLTSTVDIGAHAPKRLAEHVLCHYLARQSDSMLAGLANRLENTRV
ncbi:MAG: SRPBCC family protein [Mycobacterium sp.]